MAKQDRDGFDPSPPSQSQSPFLTPVTLNLLEPMAHDMRARFLDSTTSVDPDQIVPPSGALVPLLKPRRAHVNAHLLGISHKHM